MLSNSREGFFISFLAIDPENQEVQSTFKESPGMVLRFTVWSLLRNHRTRELKRSFMTRIESKTNTARVGIPNPY
jgi:hypothetical protein